MTPGRPDDVDAEAKEPSTAAAKRCRSSPPSPPNLHPSEPKHNDVNDSRYFDENPYYIVS
jgi:hypothetical protein